MLPTGMKCVTTKQITVPSTTSSDARAYLRRGTVNCHRHEKPIPARKEATKQHAELMRINIRNAIAKLSESSYFHWLNSPSCPPQGVPCTLSWRQGGAIQSIKVPETVRVVR